MTTRMTTPLGELLSDFATPCLSLYMPTERGFAEKQQNVKRFRNLLRSIERSLPDELSMTDRDVILAPLREMVENTRFWHHTLDGLAVFRALNLFRVFKLRHTVGELALVADSFHIKPLLRARQDGDRFEVLAITRDHVRLFQASRDSIEQVELDPAVPPSLVAALGDELTEPHASIRSVGRIGGGASGAAISYGTGSRNDEIDKDTLKYFRAVDRAICEHHSKRSHLPLVLAALPEHHAMFREVSHNSMLLSEGISGNPDAFTLEQLREKAWAIVEPSIESALQQQLDDYGAAVPRSLASDDYADVAKAALSGRVRSLLVDADRVVPGSIDHESGAIRFGDIRDPHTDDIIDDLAELTLRHGGNVTVLPHDRVPGKSGVAAVYRF